MSNFTHELILIDEADVSGCRSNQANPLHVHGEFVNFRKNGRMSPDILIGSSSWSSCSSVPSSVSIHGECVGGPRGHCRRCDRWDARSSGEVHFADNPPGPRTLSRNLAGGARLIPVVPETTALRRCELRSGNASTSPSPSIGTRFRMKGEAALKTGLRRSRERRRDCIFVLALEAASNQVIH
jgi:hypothetical protein